MSDDPYRDRAIIELKELFRQCDLADLKGAEFQRLLRLAHTEGLLPELLQDAVQQAYPTEYPDRGLLALNQKPELESLSRQSLLLDHPVHRRIAYARTYLKSLFRLAA